MDKMNNVIEIIKHVCTDKPMDFYQFIDNSLAKEQKQFIITANPEIVMLGRKNDLMNEALKKAIVIPDGIGIVKALNLLNRLAERNTGIDLVSHLLNVANEKRMKVFIYGSKQEILDTFKNICVNKWPNIELIGLYNGYTSVKCDIIQKIKESESDIILVALGTPKQELFINEFYSELHKGICVGIGGSIDVLSGNVKRAPEFFLNHNLEWLYRITTDPKRIKRFLNGNIFFVFVFLLEMITKK